MTRALYTLIFWMLVPALLIRLLVRARREPGYRYNIAGRLGLLLEAPPRSTIWVHAVSVGETRAAAPLIERLLNEYPSHELVLTQTTAAGRDVALELFGSRVRIAWMPWDLPAVQRRFIAGMRPTLLILMETEIWPNLIAACGAMRVPALLVNARMSERSMRRYRLLPHLTSSTLAGLRSILVQSEQDARRFSALGAQNIHVTGNLKFDIAPPAAQTKLAAAWRTSLDARPVLLLASTRDGEETLLLDALLPLLSEDVLIALVPRHPNRFDEVAEMLRSRGLSVCRRSTNEMPDATTRVWLGDSMGEMFAWYALADLALIGGSWLPLGGQNLIEACAVGCPVLIGPHTFNFAQATEDAIAAGAAVRVDDVHSAAREAGRLLAEPATLKAMGEAGRAFAQAHRGATERTITLIEPLLREATSP